MTGVSSEAEGVLALPPWHVLRADDVVVRTHTGPEGLTHADAAERLKTTGPVSFPAARATPREDEAAGILQTHRQ